MHKNPETSLETPSYSSEEFNYLRLFKERQSQMDQTLPPSTKLYERTELVPQHINITQIDRAAGTIIDDVTHQEVEASWNGTISLEKRLLSGEIDESQVDQAFSHLKDYFTHASRSARIRCVDGRPIEHYDESRAELKIRELGPQGAGGTPGAAVCFSLAEGPASDTYKGANFNHDVDNLADILHDLHFEVGGHTDESANGEKTGCGAIDRMPEIVRAMADFRNTNRMIELTKAVMGDMYDKDAFSLVLGNAVKMSASEKSYFGEYKPNIFDRINKHTKNAVSKLVGNHNEVAAIINRMYGYTFHRDEFSAASRHKLQAFNYDYWKSVEMAESVVKNSAKYAHLNADEKLRLGKRILTARVMYSVATLMTLTDGSIRLYVVDETADDGSVIDLHENFVARDSSTPRAVIKKEN